MNRLIGSRKHRAPCAALIFAAGLASPASAIEKHWTCDANGAWSTASCWSPVGTPAPTDNAKIGDVLGVQNTAVLLDINDAVNDIDITDGMTLNTNSHTLDVNLEISVSGRNTVGDSSFPSRLYVEQIVEGPEVTAGVISTHDGAEVELHGGGLFLENSLSIGAQSTLRGAGTVVLDSPFRDLINDGVIVAGPGALSFSQTGAGTFDIDGTSGGGDLDLTAASNSSLAFHGDSIFDSFGATLSMIRGTLLNMDLAEPWTVESTGAFNIYGPGIGGPARVSGAPLTFNGTINLYSGAQFQVDADITLGANSEFVTGLDATADFAGDAVINGGLYTVNQDSNLHFNGATEVHAGMFITHSDESTTGSVDFNGPTTWDGSVSVTGFARQNGPAHVTGPTTITGDTFDMDGSDDADWDIDSNIILNVDRIDYSGNTFNTTLDLAGNGRINVNLSTPSTYWIMAGTMNLSGNTLLFSTRVGGESPLYITGEVNVTGKNDIATSSIVSSTSTFNIAGAASALRFMSSVLIGAGITFTGDGLLQVGGVGDMVINSGLNTGAVGLNNTGRLHVGSGAGVISVDRFQNSGTWEVQIGGHAAGSEYDRIVSNGPATIGGTLEVELIPTPAGAVFLPSVGDEFTILNAVGGVTGSFAPGVTSTVGPNTYHWEVVIGGADVVLRLASIDIPCGADFNHDGVVNSQDFFDFLNVFFANLPDADFNVDAAVNSQDFFDFLNAFFSGC